MAHPVLWLGVIILKLLVLFKAGEAHTKKEMKDAVEEELREMNIPNDWATEILDGVDEKVRDQELSLESFIEALEEVFDDIKGGTSKRFGAAIDAIKEMPKDLRENLAAKLSKAAEILRGENRD